VTANTPTGIAGCERLGVGIASHYGPGDGVAMNFCTWALRHISGCGSVTITSLDTGLSVTAPVIDFCDCYTGTSRERIVDLQYGVLMALGLENEQTIFEGVTRGLYEVEVSRGAISASTQQPVVGELPDTRTQARRGGRQPESSGFEKR
jgi:hypothetical protein